MSFLFVIACTLSGCAGFSINRVKYYNEVIATVGTTSITRHDLLTAYNNYGRSYYVSQQGMEEDEAIAATLDLLIDREALYLYAKQDANKTYNPTEYQVNSSIESVFNSLDEQMSNYLTTAETIYNVKANSTSGDNSTNEETAYIYSTYNKRAKLVIDEEKSTEDNTVYKIEYIAEDEPTTTNDPIIDNKALLTTYADNADNYSQLITAIKNKYLQLFKSNVNSKYPANKATDIYNHAISSLTNDLLNYEYYLRDTNGKTYSKNFDDMLYRYFSRAFDGVVQSQYLTNIQTHFLKNQTLSTQALINAYNSQVIYDSIVYGSDIDSYKSTLTGISTNGDTILYHPELEDGTEFGYFIHMLIQFSDDEKSAIDALDIKNMSDDDEHAQEKKDAYEDILNNLKVAPRNLTTGLTSGKDEDKLSINQIMEEYQAILSIKDYNSRLAVFVQFMYKYSADPGLLSGGMPYVVGTNGNTQMVEEFTAEAVALMQGKKDNTDYGNRTTSGLKGNMTVWSDDMKYSDLCISEHGIHLIMYVEDVAAYDIKSQVADITTLQKEVNPLTHKTYFDLMFDKVYPAKDGSNYTSNNGYTSYEDRLAVESKQKNPVVKYTTKIKNTHASI